MPGRLAGNCLYLGVERILGPRERDAHMLWRNDMSIRGWRLPCSRPRARRITHILYKIYRSSWILFIGIDITHPAHATTPIYSSRLVYAGDLWLAVQGYGTIGSGPSLCPGGEGVCYNNPRSVEDQDALRINWQPSLEFPGGSQVNYLYLAAPMVGCIRGTDTLVSTSFCSLFGLSNEFNSFARLSASSSSPTSPQYDARSLAEQEYWSLSSDTAVSAIPLLTITLDFLDGRLHKPIGLEVSQTARGWSSGIGRRFVIVDLWIRNISQTLLENVCVGFNIWPTAVHYSRIGSDRSGTFAGLLETVPVDPNLPTGIVDTANIVWTANNSGSPNPVFSRMSPTSVVGYRILRAPGGRFGFNWWGAYTQEGGPEGTWGPRRNVNLSDHTGARAWPLGDRALYQQMLNGELDYDPWSTLRDFSPQGWSPPPSNTETATALASGSSAIFLHMSYGPIAVLRPGDSIPLTYAVCVGEKFHTVPDNYARNFSPRDPSRYRENLDFSDLLNSARAADWYFDNPGVDTDGDGYAGKFYLDDCAGPGGTGCDTVWYKGDGVPDWGGPKTPPSPDFEPTTRPHAVTLRWTGAVSETAKDPLSRQRDFEGYRVYTARAHTTDGYALLASWDVPDDFNRFVYDEGRGTWKEASYPLTTAQWREELDDPAFNPEEYAHPSLAYAYVDTTADTVRDAAGQIIRIVTQQRRSYWAPEGPNHGNNYADGGQYHDNRIQRVGVRDTVIGEDTLQYGLYEMTIDNLNAAVPMWFAVTSFDYGDYRRGVDPLEGSPAANAEYAFPVYSADAVRDSGLKVTVYPNPYKILFTDAAGNQTNYFEQGYEGYGQTALDERDRRIWFANLPDTATIRIWSLDGDLIREIQHPDRFLTRYSSVVGWDLISRNTQAVVSGIYIWRVDSRLGSQVGKIVIIK